MPGRRKDTMDIREIVRRLRAGESERQITQALGGEPDLTQASALAQSLSPRSWG